MADLLHIPFEPGLMDSADPVVIGGKLYQAENVRFRQLGHAEKKFGYAVPTFGMQGGTGAQRFRWPQTPTGVPNALGEYQGRPFIVSDASLMVGAPTGSFHVDGGANRLGANQLLAPNKLSRVLPDRAQPITSGIVDYNAYQVCRMDCCRIGLDSILYLWDDSFDWGYAVKSYDGTVIHTEYSPLRDPTDPGNATLARATCPRCISSSSSTSGSPSSPRVYLRQGLKLAYTSISPHTNLPGDGGLTEYRTYFYPVGNPTLNTVDSLFDVCTSDDTGFGVYLVWQSSATELTVSYYSSGIDFAATASVTWAPGAIVTSLSIVSNTSYVYITYLSAGVMYHISFNASLGAQQGPATLANTYTYQPPQASLVAISSTLVGVVYNGVINAAAAAGNNSRCVEVAVVTPSTLAFVRQKRFWHFGQASQAFKMDGRYYQWFATDNDLNSIALYHVPAVSGWSNQRTYWMLELSDLDNMPTNFPTPVMTAAPMIANYFTSVNNNMLPKVTEIRGQFFVPLKEVVRTREAPDATLPQQVDVIAPTAVSWFGVGLDGQPAATKVNSLSEILNSRRDFVEAGGALHFAGGEIAEYSGVLNEAGFVHYPVIVEARRMTGGGGAGVGISGTFQYSAIYEWRDPQGRRHRSQPSDPVSVTLGAAGTLDAAKIFVTTLAAGKGTVPTGMNVGAPVVHIYRTTNGGTTFYQTTSDYNGYAPVASPSPTGGTVSYTDTRTDTTLTTREILYTQGGVLGNIVPPAARFTTEGGGRVWLGGLLKPRRIVCSKLIVDGEPVQFSDDVSFTIDVPEDVTGIRWGDGSLIVFSKNSIYLINGDGPNDQGVGSFNPPQRLPSDVGCVDQFSIVEVQDGWFFKSARGLEMLPRGFGPPEFVGQNIQNLDQAYPILRSAALVNQAGFTGTNAPESTVRFLMSNRSGDDCRVAVWDTKLKTWISTDKYTVGDLALIGSHAGNAVTVRDNLSKVNPILRETAGIYSDGSVSTGFIQTKLRTGNIRPFGLLGYGRVNRIGLIGTLQAPANIYLKITQDGNNVATMTAVGKTGAPGTRFYQQYMLPTAQCNSIDLEIWDDCAPVAAPISMFQPKAFNLWTLAANTTVSANSTTDPDGGSLADQIIGNPLNGPYYATAPATNLVAGTATYTVSAKTDGVIPYIFLGETTTNGCFFNVSAGTVGTALGTAVGTITALGNGWYDCQVVLTVGTTTVLVGPSTGGSSLNYSGDGTHGPYLYNARAAQTRCDTPNANTVIWHGATLEIEPEPGLPRLEPASQA